MAESGKKTLLAVDDSKVMLLMLKKLLADSEFEMAGQAMDGKQAIEEYRKISPDVVTLDIVMPDMDGVTALEGILQVDPDAKVVMVTSLGTKEKVIECLTKGAKSFLMKPYERDNLLETLRNVMGGDE